MHLNKFNKCKYILYCLQTVHLTCVCHLKMFSKMFSKIFSILTSPSSLLFKPNVIFWWNYFSKSHLWKQSGDDFEICSKQPFWKVLRVKVIVLYGSRRRQFNPDYCFNNTSFFLYCICIIKLQVQFLFYVWGLWNQWIKWV